MLRTLILVVVIAVSGSPAFAQTNNGAIEGRVINAATQETVITDADGKFTLELTAFTWRY